MFGKQDLKSYLEYSSSKILNILKFSNRIYILPSVVIYPTNICNYDCIMCINAKSKIRIHEKMDLSIINKIINDCSKFFFKPKIHFSGLGEPLIYPEIKEVMQLCKQKRLKWSMTTNGYLLEKYAKDIVSNNCDAINISIHGRVLEHNKIVGIANAFEKVIKGIKKLDETKKSFKKRKPPIAINCVFNNDNILYLDSTLNSLIKLPINSITFQHLSFFEEDINKNKKFLIKDKNKLERIHKFIKTIETKEYSRRVKIFPKIKNKEINNYYTKKEYKSDLSCIFPWVSVRIYPNGDVKLCGQFFGNIKQNCLKQIINSKQALKFRSLIRKKKFHSLECFRCCHRFYY